MEFKKNIDYVYIDIDLITPDEKFAIFYLEGAPTNYAISTEARVYNLKTQRLLVPRLRPDGYYDINLTFGSADSHRTFMTYRMVAETFLEGQNVENGVNTVDHIDGLDAGHGINNLEWVTHVENIKRATKKGWMKKPDSMKGENNSSHVYTEKQVREACELKVKGVNKRKISDTTGIKYDYLDKIFNGLKWADVVSEYDIKHKRKKKYPEGLKRRIEELADTGYSNPEIKSIVEDEFKIELSSSYVKDAKRNRRKK